MIKKFAETLDYEIPDVLKPHVITAIYGETQEKVDVTFPVFPNGFAVLIHVYGDLPILHVNNNSDFAPSRLNLAGQIHGTVPKMQINGRFGQNGFLLHPLTPYYLFHMKGSSFVNKWVPLEGTAKHHWSSLEESLKKCKSPIERVKLIADELIKLESNKLPSIYWLDNCIETIYHNNGSISIQDMVDTSGLSNRHFTRVFRDIVGVPPKYFCKVIQLNNFFKIINTSDDERILKLALDCGYYDQSHFIHDFKKMIGDSPERFLASKDAYVKEYLGKKSG
ncbi:helix-turn-helix domain-containing protein [Flagellimonas flava]|uniref:AraC-type DNA-binding protein n=1 Tax=Flagellimonas flava TaxID=570519 RepID=A0A1M5MBQ7_9FLAO|nr:AraC family transcriptional regulator [Allomuricauda flava]SHG74696.1 AraC-type DNA-binding protein [Allomuricauda flava]